MKSMYSVIGKKIAIAIEICRPGMAPKTSPITMPGTTTSHGDALEKSIPRADCNDGQSIIRSA
jgi:hypothetical protein